MESDASILGLEIAGEGGRDGIDLSLLPVSVIAVPHRYGERIVLTDGYRRIGLETYGGSLLQGNVSVRYLLDHDAGIARKITALRRFLTLLDTRRFPQSLFPRDRRADRWILALRAHDAQAAGASQREIAEVLFANLYRRGEWKNNSQFLRLRVNRLLSLARHTVAGGYRALMR